MKINGSFVLREIAGDHVLIPVGENATKVNGIIAINKTCAVIWEGIEQGKSKDEIVETLLDRFDADRVVVEQDFDELVENMVKAGFLLN